MKFTVVTILPELIEPALAAGVVGRAREAGAIAVATVNPREFTRDRHRTVDDTPYGGGPGMVMKPEPLLAAIGQAAGSPPAHRILMTPAGATLTQARIRELAALPHVVLVCGRYEGIDERVIDLAIDEQLSIGDYVLSGGELAALVVIDAVARFVPGVLGESTSVDDESHSAGLLEYPQYTRPLRLVAPAAGSPREAGVAAGQGAGAAAGQGAGAAAGQGAGADAGQGAGADAGQGAGAAAGQGAGAAAGQGAGADAGSDAGPGVVADAGPETGIAHVVPPILTSGNHGAIAAWRRRQAIERTALHARTHLALVHHPVIDRTGAVVTTSLTNFDIHDLARSSLTYGLAGYHIVTPIASQRDKAAHIARLWIDDAHGEHRARALELVRTAGSIDAVIAEIAAAHGAAPMLVATSARRESFPGAVRRTPVELVAEASADPAPLLILLGTGWGLADALIPSVSRVLAPIEGASDWNHLSVRSAGAILLDRLFGGLFGGLFGDLYGGRFGR
jgi:tRNA (guanine37-N1)-methyltransferase